MERKKDLTPQPLRDPEAEAFFTYLEVEKDASPLTIVNYRDDLLRFHEFLEKRMTKVEWGQVRILDIRAYLAQLHDEGLARRTIAR
ncbi:site-specific integrase, partial [Acidaminococcus timonensis]